MVWGQKFTISLTWLKSKCVKAGLCSSGNASTDYVSLPPAASRDCIRHRDHAFFCRQSSQHSIFRSLSDPSAFVL